VAAATPYYMLAWLVVLVGARWPLRLAAGEKGPLSELEVKGA